MATSIIAGSTSSPMTAGMLPPSAIDQIELLFHEHTIAGAWILAGDDAEALRLGAELAAQHHSPVVITMDDVQDEHVRYMHKLRSFCKLLVISYQAWYKLRYEVEVFILPRQTLLVFGDIPDGSMKFVERWMHEARGRGFHHDSGTQMQYCIHYADDHNTTLI